MSDEARDLLIEAAASAHRTRDASGLVQPSTNLLDLAPEDREAAFDHQIAARRLEALVDPEGLNGTVRAVLARIENLPQAPW